MRLKQSLTAQKQSGISHEEVRTIEREFGVYLLSPARPTISPNQQFGVYDIDNRHAADIVAESIFFTMADLRQKVEKICKEFGE